MASHPVSGVHWFRRDLRLEDNPAWAELIQRCGRVTALFVLDRRVLAKVGGPRRQYLVHTLRSLDASLRELGGRLCVLEGDPSVVVPSVVTSVGATAVSWNEEITPFGRRRDADVADRLAAADVELIREHGCYVHAPGTLHGSAGHVPQVFGAFHRLWAATPWPSWPDDADTDVLVADEPGNQALLDSLIAGDPGLDEAATSRLAVGEEAVSQQLDEWAASAVDRYESLRDDIAAQHTSELSAALHLGSVSPRTVVTVVASRSSGAEAFTRQLAWRDWWAHLLLERPHLQTRSMAAKYDSIEWRSDADVDGDFEAWRRGTTGYPIVDAAMRELASTGWMHNRLRMIVASFLVKDLLIDWRRGERYFRAQLIDGDVAQNVGNWQWVAGTGPDAAPYFRIFNPITQSRTHDPKGVYLRQWLPELGALDDRSIHAPWELGPLAAAAAGVTLGETYPWPIVDHAEARVRTLAVYKAATSTTPQG